MTCLRYALGAFDEEMIPLLLAACQNYLMTQTVAMNIPGDAHQQKQQLLRSLVKHSLGSMLLRHVTH